jgi:molybdenum cofactor cytidylyltransferase
MIIAVVPAAGQSQRMGRPKLLLPLGPRRVIEHVLDALVASRVDETIVVVPPGAEELRAVISTYPVHIVPLDAQTPDMRASIIEGLNHAQRQRAQAPDAFLVALADQPSVSSRVIDALVARFRSSNRSIFIPTYNGRRGHPVLFAWRHVQQIRALPADQGLNRLVAQLDAEVEECPFDDPGLVEDLDTPADYSRLDARHW